MTEVYFDENVKLNYNVMIMLIDFKMWVPVGSNTV